MNRERISIEVGETTGRVRFREKAVAAECRRRVATLIKSLPGARIVPTGGGQLALDVRGRRFGCFLENHRGNGRLALTLKAPRSANQRLAAYAPDRFHVPTHFRHQGWVGIWLDSPAPDWSEIEELIGNAYLLAAPKRLVTIPQTTINTTKA